MAASCHACDRASDSACARCARPLCAEHRASATGIARTVLGPRFGDGKPRCDDCEMARFWRGVSALVVIVGAVIALISLASGRWDGVFGGVGNAVVLGGFAAWHAGSLERRARSSER